MPNRNAAELIPDADQLARFRRDLEAITGEAPSPARKLGLAVSGGPDSVALLLLARAAYPDAIAAATVDHRLRAGSTEEAAWVHDLCARLGVPHDVLAPPENFVIHGNLQEQARGIRYNLLHFWAGSGTAAGLRPWRTQWIATAHQRNDVAEGFLMRARRGAGVGGLAAMPAKRAMILPNGPLLIRPLLHWPRDALAGIVADAGIEAIQDPSNVHPRFDRSRVRQLLIDSADLPSDRLAMAAHNLRHAEDALAWATDREWGARSEIEASQTVWLDAADLPYEIRRRLTLQAIDYVRFEFARKGLWRGAGVDRLIAALDAGKAATLAGVAVRPGQRWRFTLAPPRRSH